MIKVVGTLQQHSAHKTAIGRNPHNMSN